MVGTSDSFSEVVCEAVDEEEFYDVDCGVGASQISLIASDIFFACVTKIKMFYPI